ncbi:Phytoene desaturase (lycopene-forming) [Baekduia alba]|uniref:phytoene desaturase family protein n=1 Tax=Baekduia alba TaxID=2997333 RepID=UPI0023408294|nr:NAD(P)/FAD-dependent oxidoreductase [Baekduia alba]WCB94598.1 Phytoene desaturase (lycopene-forming) [Baekduia alba]
MTADARHDVVIVGGGHNGLTCAAYLARGGVDVCVLEARDSVGGCASTVEVLGGARVNICNCDHALVRATGIIEELDLAAHGLRYLDLEPAQLALPWDTGLAPWFLFSDVERTLQSLALTHPDQVAGYRRYVDDLLPAARLVMEMTGGVPTPLGVATRLAKTRGRGLAALLKLSRRSAADVLRDYFTSDALLGPVATTGPAVWGLPPQAPGTGLGALGYALRHLIAVGRPVGGSGALTDALASAVRGAGGTIRTGARVSAILCDAGTVAGVRLGEGTRVDAPVVISAGDPRRTLVELLHAPPAQARDLVARWRDRPVREGYESKVDAVVDALPRPRGLHQEHLDELGIGAVLNATMVVAPGLDAILAAHRDAEAGRVATNPLFLSNVPSVLDPTVAPAGGGHVFSLETLFTPYRLHGGWPGSAEPERWLAAFARSMEPGFLDGVRRWRLVGPDDYERDFSMPAGYAPSFAGGPLAALLGRDRELTRYTTPVSGLYLTGSGTFPGAGVSGAPGRNTARVVLGDLGVTARRAAPAYAGGGSGRPPQRNVG